MTNKNLSLTLLRLVVTLLGYASCVSCNAENKNQDLYTAENSSQSQSGTAKAHTTVTVAEALPDDLINRVQDVDLRQRLRKIREDPSKINKLDDDYMDETALYHAASVGELEALKGLLQAGANPNVLRAYSATSPLATAIYNGHLEVVQALIADPRTNVNARDDRGYTPLHWAASDGHLAVVQALLARGADINEGDNSGITPLHRAVSAGHLAVVQALIEGGANINVRNNYGKTPLRLAERGGHQQVVQALIEAGAVQ